MISDDWRVDAFYVFLTQIPIAYYIHQDALRDWWESRRPRKTQIIHISGAERKRRRIVALAQQEAAAMRAFNARIASVPADIRHRLFSMVGGDKDAAMRLVSYERNRTPGKSESYYWQAAIEQLLIDRRAY